MGKSIEYKNENIEPQINNSHLKLMYYWASIISLEIMFYFLTCLGNYFPEYGTFTNLMV